MEAKIENGKLIITLPMQERPSKSGKTIIVASTNGNIPSTVQHKGKIVIIGVNAYVSK